MRTVGTFARIASTLLLLVLLPWLYLANTAGHALPDGDEPIYAEMGREMVRTGNYVDLQWQGQVQLVRPPFVIWTLALGHRLLGDERAVRWPLAGFSALTVVLVLLLGWEWGLQLGWSTGRAWGWGALSAGLLATSSLQIGYARYLESEPFLCALIVGAWLLWERGRWQPWARVAFGVVAGGALLCKQAIGGLALLPLFVDVVTPQKGAKTGSVRGSTWLGLALLLAVFIPWHWLAWQRHGKAFVDGYFFGNLVDRARMPMLHLTRPTFYARELWRSEGGFALLAVAALVWVAVRGIRERRMALLLLAATAGPLLLFSVVKSRYDYYILVSYPAAALAVGWALATMVKNGRLYLALAVLLVGAQASLRLPQLADFNGEDELRGLVQLANETRADAPLYLYNRHPYAARFYSRAPTVMTLLESPDDLATAEMLARTGMPISARLATSLPQTLNELPAPWVLLLPRPRAGLLPPSFNPTAESVHYLVFVK